MVRVLGLLLSALSFCPWAVGQALNCNLDGYKPLEGLKAEVHQGVVEINWRGDQDEQLRAEFTTRQGQPVVRELAASANGAKWVVLGRDLTPEFEVTSGIRRLAHTQAETLQSLHGGVLTPDLIDREKWNAFWDAPLSVPGNPGAGDESIGLPRAPGEIRRAWATYH